MFGLISRILEMLFRLVNQLLLVDINAIPETYNYKAFIVNVLSNDPAILSLPSLNRNVMQRNSCSISFTIMETYDELPYREINHPAKKLNRLLNQRYLI